MFRKNRIKRLIRKGFIPSVEIGVVDWDGSFEYEGTLTEPLKGDSREHLMEESDHFDIEETIEENHFSDYFDALDYAIEKGFELVKLKEKNIKDG